MGFFEVEEYVVFPAVTPPEPETDGGRCRPRLLASMLESFAPTSSSATSSPRRRRSRRRSPGCRNATLIPTVYPVQGAGLPPFALGLAGTADGRGRGPVATAASRDCGGLRPSTRWLRRVPGLLGGAREELGLAPVAGDPAFTTYGPISDGLAMVATFPQLEYPRRWPESVHVDRPDALRARSPRGPVPPPGDEPLVLVAPSTVQDPGVELVRTRARGARRRAGAGAGDAQPSRGALAAHPLPANATVVDWLDLREGDAAGLAGDHQRRSRHGHARPARGRSGARLPRRGRHGRERGPGDLGGRRADAAAPLAQRATPSRRSVRRLLARRRVRAARRRAGRLGARQRRRRAGRRAGRALRLDSPLVSSGEPR